MVKSYTSNSSKHEKYLWIALCLTFSFMIVEAIGGWLSGSLALLTDAVHMFTDFSALVIALGAIQIAKKVADKKRTFGYYRFEILAASVNAVILFIAAFFIFYEAIHRLQHPQQIQSLGMLIVAVFGLISNLIALRLLHQGSQESLNIKGAYLEAWADMIGSVAVIVAAIIIYFTKWPWVDSVTAMLIGLWILPRSWTLLKESINILLEGVPEGVELVEIQSAIAKIPGVLDMHDVHVWALTSGTFSLTAHISVDPKHAEVDKILETATDILMNQFQIAHTTLQIETDRCFHNPLPHVF